MRNKKQSLSKEESRLFVCFSLIIEVKGSRQNKKYICMSLLNYFQKLPRDVANVPLVSSELTGRETEEVSKELKKTKGKKGKSIVSGHHNNGLKLANMPQKMEMPA